MIDNEEVDEKQVSENLQNLLINTKKQPESAEKEENEGETYFSCSDTVPTYNLPFFVHLPKAEPSGYQKIDMEPCVGQKGIGYSIVTSEPGIVQTVEALPYSQHEFNKTVYEILDRLIRFPLSSMTCAAAVGKLDNMLAKMNKPEVGNES